MQNSSCNTRGYLSEAAPRSWLRGSPAFRCSASSWGYSKQPVPSAVSSTALFCVLGMQCQAPQCPLPGIALAAASGMAPPGVNPGARSAVLVVALFGWEVKTPYFAILRHQDNSVTSPSRPHQSGKRQAGSQSFRSWNKALAKFLMSENFANCCCNKHSDWLLCRLG